MACDPQNQCRDYTYLERNDKMMVSTQAYAFVSVIYIKLDKMCVFLRRKRHVEVEMYLSTIHGYTSTLGRL